MSRFGKMDELFIYSSPMAVYISTGIRAYV